MPANDPQRTRLVVVAPIVAGGLALQAVGYAIGRAGHVQLALAFFFTGLVTIFAPCAWRLLAERARRPERIQVAVLLGVALVVSYYLLSPLLFTGYDELLHQTRSGSSRVSGPCSPRTRSCRSAPRFRASSSSPSRCGG